MYVREQLEPEFQLLVAASLPGRLDAADLALLPGLELLAGDALRRPADLEALALELRDQRDDLRDRVDAGPVEDLVYAAEELFRPSGRVAGLAALKLHQEASPCAVCARGDLSARVALNYRNIL